MEATQSFKRKRTRIVRTRPIGGDLTYDGNRLWTSASSGQYEVRFKNAVIENVSTRCGLRPRLLLRFEVLGGPMSMNEAGKWEHGNRNAGKVVPLWQFLGNDVDNPALSPNAWFSSSVTNKRGNSLSEKLQAFGRSVRYVVVVWPGTGPAKIVAYSFSTPYAKADVDRLLKDLGAADV
ncbi:MAG TPA: hypothetical protein PLE60_15475 [Candidatus Latescibacteria bacterium]|nr:hypothetical protein [Candidatus Latescibacterota bacterium]